MVDKRATPAVVAEQEKRIAADAEKASIERSGQLTERLLVYAQAYCREQNLTPEEWVFAAALLTVNLRETFPPGKAAFDTIAAGAAEYYDSAT